MWDIATPLLHLKLMIQGLHISLLRGYLLEHSSHRPVLRRTSSGKVHHIFGADSRCWASLVMFIRRPLESSAGVRKNVATSRRLPLLVSSLPALPSAICII